MRAFHNRKVDEIDEMADASAQGRRYLMELARTLGAQTEQTYAVEVPATVKKGIQHPNRLAQIRLAWTQIHMSAPSYVKGHSAWRYGLSGLGSQNRLRRRRRGSRS